MFNLLPRSTFIALLGTIPTIVACSSGDAASSSDSKLETTARVQQPAVTVHDWFPWVYFPLPVCFVQGGKGSTQLSQQEYEHQKQFTMDTINSTWARVPGLTFQNAGECPVGSDGGPIKSNSTLSVVLTREGPALCQRGMSAICTFGITDAETIVHEFGHGLGLAHENQRDPKVTSCGSELAQLNSCLKCKSDFNATGYCSATDYNGCVKSDPPVFGSSVNLSSSCPAKDSNGKCGYCPKCLTTPLKEVDSVIGDQGPLPDPIFLTRFDPVSVMNYCNHLNGRGDDDFGPSSLDLLGVEIIYPANLHGHGLGCARGCFDIGQDVVVRSDGSLSSDFTMRGALGIVPKWQLDRIAISEFLGASLVKSGTLNYFYSDWRNRTHTGHGTVTKSDALHTAILESPIQALWL